MRIGVFDSGIGGITVLTALREAFPEAEYIYLGDTANLPYGTKSPAQVVKLSLECAQYLKEKNVDHVVVACNTASSLALTEIRQVLDPIPVDGVVEPGVRAVMAELDQEALPVLVLATRATVRSQAYGKSLRTLLNEKMQPVFEQSCPLLVPMIEEGWTDHPVLHQTIEEYVRPYRQQFPRGIALLGCTHYPWIQKAVEAALPGWKVVNSARVIAQAVAESLKKELADPSERGRSERSGVGPVNWVFTDPEAIPASVRKLMEISNGE
jgi:glutamate racemase